jgi:hypothetical protein
VRRYQQENAEHLADYHRRRQQENREKKRANDRRYRERRRQDPEYREQRRAKARRGASPEPGLCGEPAGRQSPLPGSESAPDSPTGTTTERIESPVQAVAGRRGVADRTPARVGQDLANGLPANAARHGGHDPPSLLWRALGLLCGLRHLLCRLGHGGFLLRLLHPGSFRHAIEV